MFHNWKIRWRLFVLVLVGAGLILAAVISYGNHLSLQVLEKEMEDEAWQLSNATANRIITVEKAITKIAGTLAMVVRQEVLLSREEVHRLLEQLVLENEELSGIAVTFEPSSASSGTLAGALTVERQGIQLVRGDMNSSQRYVIEDWYALPRSLLRPYWSEPYSVRNGDRDVLMVTYSVPVYKAAAQTQFIGVVKCDLSLEWLQELLLSLPLEKNGYAFLLSQNGTYISHPKKDFILKENIFSQAEGQNNPLLRSLGINMIKSRSGFIRFDEIITEEKGWLLYQPITSTGWVLGVFFPQDAMTATIVDLSRKEIAIGFVGFLLLIPMMLAIARSITRPLQELDEAAKRLAAGDLDAPMPVIRGKDEVATLTGSFAAMRDEIKVYVAKLQQETATRERIDSELRIARDIQMSLVPHNFVSLPTACFELHAFMNPAKEVGGDFYDFFRLDQDHLCIAIGDVSGKGVPAALFMAVSRTLQRAFIQAGSSPGAALAKLNNDMAENNEYCMFVTIFCLVIHLPSGTYRFANGGHNLPYHIGREGKLSMLPKTQGIALGVMEDIPVEEAGGVLAAGDTLFFYTDGVTEAMNRDDELFGDSRAAASLTGKEEMSCVAIIEAMSGAIEEFVDGAEQSDDITMVAFRYRGDDSLRQGKENGQ